MHFPGFSVEAAKFLWLVKSADWAATREHRSGNSSDFPVHHVALGAGGISTRNLSDLKDLPEYGAF